MTGTPPPSPTSAAAADAKAKAAADAKAKAAAEARAAVLNREAAEKRARDALARTTQERAAADAPDGDADPLSDEETSDVSDPRDLRQALLLHEAAAIANLHAQAVAVQNIRALVPVVLDLNAGNYTRWHDQLLTVGKYSLQAHVLQDDQAPTFPN